MDNDQQVQVIEARLDALDGMPVSDDRSAREAFTHVMVTVSRISQLSAQVRGQAIMGAGRPPMTSLKISGRGLTALSAP